MYIHVQCTCTYMYIYIIYYLFNSYIISSETFGFLVYRPPMDVTVTMSEALAGVTFYYIAATDGNTRIFPMSVGIINLATFSVVHMASQTRIFAISIQRSTQVLDSSQVNLTLTVIGMLILLMGVVSIRALELKPRLRNDSIQIHITNASIQFQ